MSTSNSAPGVGVTAKDGGLSTAASVADGGPNDKEPDGQYLPEGVKSMEGQYVDVISPWTPTAADFPAAIRGAKTTWTRATQLRAWEAQRMFYEHTQYSPCC